MKRGDFASCDERTEIEEYGHKLLPQLTCKEKEVVSKVLDDDDYNIRIQLDYNIHLPEDLKLLEEDYMLLLQTNPDDSSQSKSCDNPCDDSDTYRRRRSVKKTKRNSVHTDYE